MRDSQSTRKGLELPGAGPTRSGGFTLFEMLVVLALVASLSLLLIPNIGTTRQSTDATAAAREMASVLLQMELRARTNGRVAELTIDLSKGTYRSGDQHGPAIAGTLPQTVRLALTVAETEQQSRNSARLRFYPDGRTSGARIRFTSDGSAVEVDLHWLSGRISTHLVRKEAG